MKLNHLIIIGALCGALLLPSSASSWGVVGLSAGSGGGGSFCSGTELFCEDFEGTDTTWDTTPASEDCDGYDANGDYCDDDTTTVKNGSESLGVCGWYTQMCVKDFTSTSSEFYLDYWWRTTDETSSYGIAVYNATSNWYVLSHYQDSDGTLRIYYANSPYVDSNYAITANTWYHIRIYYKEESGGNNGIIQCWITTDAEFAGDDSDRYINVTNADTGDSNDAEEIRLRGNNPSAGTTINYYDDVKIVAGAPS